MDWIFLWIVHTTVLLYCTWRLQRRTMNGDAGYRFPYANSHPLTPPSHFISSCLYCSALIVQAPPTVLSHLATLDSLLSLVWYSAVQYSMILTVQHMDSCSCCVPHAWFLSIYTQYKVESSRLQYSPVPYRT